MSGIWGHTIDRFLAELSMPVAPGEAGLEEGIWESLVVETKSRDEQS